MRAVPIECSFTISIVIQKVLLSRNDEIQDYDKDSWWIVMFVSMLHIYMLIYSNYSGLLSALILFFLYLLLIHFFLGEKSALMILFFLSWCCLGNRRNSKLASLSSFQVIVFYVRTRGFLYESLLMWNRRMYVGWICLRNH